MLGSADWSAHTPIYRQLYDRLVAMVLEGQLREGDAFPSVRQVAADVQINPLTVSKAYQELADQGVVDKRRGLGWFVAPHAKALLQRLERERFLTEEWPVLRARLHRLGLTPAELPLESLP